ncbi:GrpB family protein [soil metagenome]
MFDMPGSPSTSMHRVRVVPSDPAWPALHETEAAQLRAAFDPAFVEIHHIGSTAIKGVFAKPIIDMLMIVDDLNLLDARSDAMRRLGYRCKSEFGIPGRRYFSKPHEGVRTHHVHAFESGSAGAARHLAFRDYMNRHPEAAQAYSALKQGLAARFPDDMQSYVDGKAEFIRRHEALAIDWRLSGKQEE